MLKDICTSASMLYEGGWRAEDKEELIKEYNLLEEEADKICEELKKFEEQSEGVLNMKDWRKEFELLDKNENGWAIITANEYNTDDLETDILDEIEFQGGECAIEEYDENNKLIRLSYRF